MKIERINIALNLTATENSDEYGFPIKKYPDLRIITETGKKFEIAKFFEDVYGYSTLEYLFLILYLDEKRSKKSKKRVLSLEIFEEISNAFFNEKELFICEGKGIPYDKRFDILDDAKIEYRNN